MQQRIHPLIRYFFYLLAGFCFITLSGIRRDNQQVSLMSAESSRWVTQASSLQDDIEHSTPLNRMTLIATHNSYNSTAYQIPFIRSVDPNQTLSIPAQLDAGARSIELDIHWTRNYLFKQSILLCHGKPDHTGCSVFDRPAKQGLKEIRYWLARHPDQMLILYLEQHLDGHEEIMARQLKHYLGNYIYQPRGSYSSCKALNGNLSRDTIIKSGKPLIILSEGCNQKAITWNSLVFAGVKGGVANSLIESHADLFHASTSIFPSDPLHRGIWRIYEDRTHYSNWRHPTRKIDPSSIREMISNRINWIAMDMLQNNDARLASRIWSWAPGFPHNPANQCAAYSKTAHGVIDLPCHASTFPFACRNIKTDEIRITSTQGKAQRGTQHCRQLGLSWRYYLPQNALEMTTLASSIKTANYNYIWLNYNKNKSGKWMVNGFT